MTSFLTTLWQDESGQDLAEYALLLVLIAVVVAVAIVGFRNVIEEGFLRATNRLQDGLDQAGG